MQPFLLEEAEGKNQLGIALKSGRKPCWQPEVQKERPHQRLHPKNFDLAVRTLVPDESDWWMKEKIRYWIQIGKIARPEPTRIVAGWYCGMCSYFSWGTNIENI